MNHRENPIEMADDSEAEAAQFQPTLVYVDRDNKLSHVKNSIPKQAA